MERSYFRSYTHWTLFGKVRTVLKVKNKKETLISFLQVDGENKTEAFQIENGIDILGNMIESNVLSVNRTEYGNLHNHGHNLISYVHDPENKYLVGFIKINILFRT